VGGQCIPLDPHYLEWKAKEFNFNTHFISLAGEINRKMPEFVVEKAARILNEDGKALSRSKVLLLGISYKKNLDDWRESPSLEVMDLLRERGAGVQFHDPHVPDFQRKGHEKETGVALDEASLQEADLAVILTDHDMINYDQVVARSRRVLDTRNATKKLTQKSEKVVLL